MTKSNQQPWRLTRVQTTRLCFLTLSERQNEWCDSCVIIIQAMLYAFNTAWRLFCSSPTLSSISAITIEHNLLDAVYQISSSRSTLNEQHAFIFMFGILMQTQKVKDRLWNWSREKWMKRAHLKWDVSLRQTLRRCEHLAVGAPSGQKNQPRSLWKVTPH